MLPAGASGTSAVPLGDRVCSSGDFAADHAAPDAAAGLVRRGIRPARKRMRCPAGVRKVVLMLPMAPASAPETAAAGAATRIEIGDAAACTKLQFGVTPAAEEGLREGAVGGRQQQGEGGACQRPAAASRRCVDDRFHSSPQKKRNQKIVGTAKKPRSAARRSKAPRRPLRASGAVNFGPCTIPATFDSGPAGIAVRGHGAGRDGSNVMLVTEGSAPSAKLDVRRDSAD